MTFKFPCPHCGQRVAATDELVGNSVACPTCAETFVVRSPAELPVVVMNPAGSAPLPSSSRNRSHYWGILGTVLALTISGGAFFWINHKPIQKAPYSPPRVQRTEVNVAPEGIPETASSRAGLIPGLPGPTETVPPPSNSIPGLPDVPGLPAPPSSLESVAPTGGNAGAVIIFPKPESTDATLQAKLNKIIIPRTDFKDTTLTQCVDFLNYKSKEFDPQRVGVNVKIDPAIPPSTIGLRLTLRIDDVSQMEILNYVTHLCGLKFRIDASGVTLLPKDDTKGVEWFLKAAAQGNALAQCDLGYMYDSGQGISKDAAKAFDWYRKAAAQGHASAQYNIGSMYANGEGIPVDVTQALEWYQKAAAQGNTSAQYNLACMYSGGKGVPKDAAKAFEWCQKAAAQGHASAQYNLGVAYAGGQGVRKDDAKAFDWFQKAATQGNPEAKEWIRNYTAGSQAKPSPK